MNMNYLSPPITDDASFLAIMVGFARLHSVLTESGYLDPDTGLLKDENDSHIARVVFIDGLVARMVRECPGRWDYDLLLADLSHLYLSSSRMIQ